MSRTFFLVFLTAGTIFPQFTVTDNNLQSSFVATGIPGTQHQIGSDAAGNVYVADELPGGFTGSAIHRVDSAGAVTLNWIPAIGGLASAGQMLRNPVDGLCYILSHWQGGLVHNQVNRIEPTGSLTVLHDVLWGIGHGFALDNTGDWFVGTSSGFQPAVIHRIPAATIGVSPEVPWAPGVAANAWLAAADGGAMLVADLNAVTRVVPGQPNTVVHVQGSSPATSGFSWRGLVQCPFGPGHIVTAAEPLVSQPGMALCSATWIGPGGPHGLAWDIVPTPGDFAVATDGASLLILSQGTLRRLTVQQSGLIPGTLVAPSNPTAGGPFSMLITGRAFSISPIVVAADQILGPPMFPGGVLPIPPFGVVHTSLGLLPTFTPLHDGLGVFSSVDPTAFLDPVGQWVSPTYVLPTSSSGLSLVLQAYIPDALAPNGLFWITNPVFVSVL